jgi:mannitol-specific phosphotransferase system IIBC component
VNNSNFFHILNGLGALIGVLIAFMSYRKSNQKGSEKQVESIQFMLNTHEKKLAVLEERIDNQKERLDRLK